MQYYLILLSDDGRTLNETFRKTQCCKQISKKEHLAFVG